MKKLIAVLFAFLFSSLGSFVFGDEVVILDPKGGLYKQGNPMTIRWDYTFLEHYPTNALEKLMGVWLAKPSVPQGQGWIKFKNIAYVDVLSSKYTWFVEATAGTYNIYLQMIGRPDINSASLPVTISSEIAPCKIVIPSPEAGKVFFIGDKLPIQWMTENIKKYKQVYIGYWYPDGTKAGGFPIPNTGSYEDLIANEKEEGNWRIGIETPDGKCVGMSGVFSIKKKPIFKIRQ